MHTIGVDVGGTNIAVLVLDDDTVVGSAKRKTPTDGDHLGVVDVIVAGVHGALDDAELAVDQVAAVGVGTPGIVSDGTVGGASNVPGFQTRFALGELLTDNLGMPVRLVNDVTAAAVGEHRRGAGCGYDHLLCVFAGTGVGGGLILGGRIFEGAHGGAGEFGHQVVRQGGAMCPCGHRGCVEAYAGRHAMSLAAEGAVAAGRETSLFDVMARKGKSRATSGVYKEALELGDRFVADLIDDAVHALAAGIASAVNLLDLEAVVLGGGLGDKLGEPFRARVEVAMQPHLFAVPPRVELVSATLGDDGGAIGAGLLAREVA